MTTFRGTFTALITPFMEIGNVDYYALEKIIEFQVRSGIDGIVPCGTTGESPTLSHEEHDRVIAKTVQYAKGRVPVIAGTGSNATSEAIRLSQHAEDAGVDAVLLVNPYYNKPTQEGMYEYFKAVAGATDKGIVLYNVPGRTGANLKAETTLRLAEIPNIIAIKEASGNYSQISEIIRNAPEVVDAILHEAAHPPVLRLRHGNGIANVQPLAVNCRLNLKNGLLFRTGSYPTAPCNEASTSQRA